MGSFCCCLRADDSEDYTNSNNNVRRRCLCLSCFVQNFLHMYATLFQRRDSVPSSILGTAYVNSPASLYSSLTDVYESTIRSLPYDGETRHCRLQREGLVSRREKGSSHSQEDSKPLRGADDADSETFSTGEKWNSFEQGLTERQSKSSQNHSSAKSQVGVGYTYWSAEEEDVCPTCLEEYTPENPKIVAKCSHHFHLSCIYEWMERSENCPVCGKVSSFPDFSSP
ncbi:hypothetical protein Gogos_016412 [Gossypium gossypioides]|uniref:RING-type E3 ubiquitin transferase n=1 Tax=Gossypium gossypioides TaxID=34282 RepID=A0A7J9B7Q2_GOSGO|nr:hypothetical protein [Gossypium gossypioides]